MDIYREKMSSEIQLLNRKAKLIFCLLSCEKLLPNYKYFSEIYKFGSDKKLKEIIDFLFDFVLEEKEITEDQVIFFIEEIERITPDTNDFETILVSFALDACTSVLSLLYFIRDNEIEHILDVVTYARDTVDMFIQERDDLDLNKINIESIINNDYLMLAEKERQIKTSKYLNNLSVISLDTIEHLRQINKNEIINVSIFKK
jgi:uncharacterized protein YjaG (DUF416 family)